MARWFLSGVAGTVAWFAGILIFFGPAQLLLTDAKLQSAKMIDAFTAEPLPRIAEAPWILPVGLLVVNLCVAAAYRLVRSALAGSAWSRGAKFGLLLWLVAIPWFEFYLPFNVLHEPLPLVLLEGVCWFLTLQLVGHVVARTGGAAAAPPDCHRAPA